MPEAGPNGQIQYVMIPSLHAQSGVKPNGLEGSGWPGSSLNKQGHMRVMHVHHVQSLQPNPLQAPQMRHRLDQEGIVNDNARFLVGDGFIGHPLGQFAAGHHGYEQAAMGISQGMPVGMGMGFSQSRLSTFAAPVAQFAEPLTGEAGVLTSNTPDLRSAISGKRELTAAMAPTPNDEYPVPDVKGDNGFTAEDELSLSATLFNMSLDHASMGNFGNDFSGKLDMNRHAADEQDGGGAIRTGEGDARGGPDAQVFFQTLAQGGEGCLPSRSEHSGYRAGSQGLTGDFSAGQRPIRPDEAYRNSPFDPTLSVSDLLCPPAEMAMGITLVSCSSLRVRCQYGGVLLSS